MSLSSPRFRVVTGSFILLVGLGSLLVQAVAEDKLNRTSDLVLSVPNAVAKSEADMKAYSDPLEHTDLAIAMVPIPGGKFVMGSPKAEANRNQDEGPTREVEIRPFWMGKFEVTWDQYDAWREDIDQLRRKLMSIKAGPRDLLVDGVSKPTEEYTDMSFGMGKGDFPAICMTQHAARVFCKWLSAKTGRYYRLPTEAEWEYACRAGTKTAYSFGDDPAELDQYAWFFDNSDDAYQPVGKKQPNPWGLFDMHGNVAEWVLDQYASDYYGRDGNAVDPLNIPTKIYPRVVRGGGWDDDPEMLRSAVRKGSSDDWKDQDPQIPRSIWYHTDALSVGFRVVRPLNEPVAAQKSVKWDKTAPEQKDPED
ncbi:formylglycine-generating enzyme family protein [bacterium]|jgi:formylglycine-generating enzyme required for sulfatase activity|nr:formylglycine-generating enzyme family protein [bacterium]